MPLTEADFRRSLEECMAHYSETALVVSVERGLHRVPKREATGLPVATLEDLYEIAEARLDLSAVVD
jgi:hypothetical protein